MVGRLIYSSRAREGLSQRDLDAILEVARKNNAALGVTGVLFFVNGEFLQVLEGEEHLKPLYDKIAKDPRHTSVEVHVEEETPNRYFSQWAMAYSILDDKRVKRIGGSFNLNNAADFVTYLKRPDAYLGNLFQELIRDLTKT